jgi:membrane fusion protein (multidrug efflux system)
VRERQAKSVITGPVELAVMEKVLETTCVLESEREVSVLPRAPGLVVALHAEEGDWVKAGDLLAQLDTREAALNLRDLENALEEARQREITGQIAIDEGLSRIRTAETNLAQAQRDLNRDEQLFSGGDARVASVSEKALEASRLARDRATLELDQAKLAHRRAELDHQAAGLAVTRAEAARDRSALNLEYLSILAPIDGLVASRSLREGENVNATQAAFVVTDPNLLRAVFFRPQGERELFQGGGPLELTATTESLPGRRFAGRVERVSPTIDPTSGSFRVTARLDPVALGPDNQPDPNGPRLAPGMLLRIRLVTERRPDCLVVKKRAVEREGERAHIVLAVDGQALRLDVREGLSDLERVEVLPLDPSAPEAEQLKAGARVVVVGARDLESGEALEERAEEEGEGSPKAQQPADADLAKAAPAPKPSSGASEANATVQQHSEVQESVTEAAAADAGETPLPTKAADGAEAAAEPAGTDGETSESPGDSSASEPEATPATTPAGEQPQGQ